jgi:flavin-dependent dehydrogenase
VPDAGLLALGLAQVSGAPDGVVVDRIVVENAHGSSVTIAVRGLTVFRRAELDAFVVEQARRAGCRIVDERVQAVEPDGDRVHVQAVGDGGSFSWVVAGDGARGLGRRTSGFEHACESWGLGASVEGIETDRLVLSFPAAGDAYAWIFPRPRGVSVGIAYDLERLGHGAARSLLMRFVDRFLPGVREKLPRSRRYRYPIPLFSATTLEAVRASLARRVLLVGDAAGVADPLTREGIRYAALSGRWAAQCLAAGEPTDYADRLSRELGLEMGRAHRAADLFFEQDLAQLMVPFVRLHPGVRAVLGDLLACRQPYAGLRRRLVSALASI